MVKMAANGEKQQGHRPGIYKQKNKGHKHGKHRTKGEIERENKGKTRSITKCHSNNWCLLVSKWSLQTTRGGSFSEFRGGITSVLHVLPISQVFLYVY